MCVSNCQKIEDTRQEFLARHKRCQVLASQRVLRLRRCVVALDNQVFWRSDVLLLADLHDPLNKLCQYLTKGRCAMRQRLVMRHREIDTKPMGNCACDHQARPDIFSSDLGVRWPFCGQATLPLSIESIMTCRTPLVRSLLNQRRCQ